MTAPPLKLCQAEPGKFRRARRILCAALVMNGELFASQNAIFWVSGELDPECRCGSVIAAAFGKQRKLAAGARAELGGKTEVERLRASDMSAIGIAAPLQKTRQPEQIETLYSIAICFFGGEKCVDLAKERGKAAQIHLVVAQNAYKRIRRAAAKIVKVILRNKRGSHVVFTMPAEAGSIENVAFQLDKAHRAETKFPKRSRGM